jgi:hypothetical protein
MHDSMSQRYVRNTAATAVLYDWRTVNGLVGWEGDRSRIIRGLEEWIEVPVAAPVGTDGGVTVPDESGNNRTFTLRTRTSYNSTSLNSVWTTPGMACCAFGSDPFFQQGGMP